jgi:hypothetical protein
MAIMLSDLIEDPTLLDAEREPSQLCACGVALTFLTGRNPTPKGLACDDCYYEQLGAVVEAHPIAS